MGASFSWPWEVGNQKEHVDGRSRAHSCRAMGCYGTSRGSINVF